MSPPELVVVRTYLTRVDADLAKTALDAEGIACMIRSDDAGGLRPHLWMGGIAVLVRQADVERAEAVLAKADPGAPDAAGPEPAE
jgi:hypothetical protein